MPRFDMPALLAHTKGDVTAVYDKYHMLFEKRAAVITLAAATLSCGV